MEMSDQDDLRATAESITQDAGRLRALEQEKQQLDPQDPRVADISEQIHEISVELEGKAAAQRQLSDEARRDS
jgi:hypothetical protein